MLHRTFFLDRARAAGAADASDDEWLVTVEGQDRLSPAEAIEEGAGLYKDALRIIAAAARARRPRTRS